MSPAQNLRLTRRSLLSHGARLFGGAVALGATGSLLAACGDSGSGDSPASGTIGYQLSWTKDYEFAGSYLADDKGYWSSQDLTVNLLAGGPNSSAVQTVASGKALVGSAQIDQVAQLVATGGAKLVVLGALFQKNGLNILSRGDEPITQPKDLEGKRVGVFASNDAAWSLFLQLNDVDRKKITEVPVQFDVTPLITKDVDGFQGYAGGELTTLQSKGIEPTVMKFADFGYNPVSAGYVARASSLDDEGERAALVKFLRGEIKGWQDVVFDKAYAEGAKLTVDKYGKDLGLDLKTQQASLEALMPYVADDATAQKGLLWIADTAIQSSQRVLDNAKITATMSELVNQDLLKEVYGTTSRVV
jgi:ABC-type nitrate/sulfonate/bicarbonate transport system substrate-binding protein